MNSNEIKRAKITVKSNYEFFLEWLKIIRAYSNLTDKEEQLLARLLAKRHELSLVILDDKLLNKNLFDKTTRMEIVEQLGVKDKQQVENMFTIFRKKGIIMENNAINPTYIPQVEKSLNRFVIQFIIEKSNAE